MRAQWRRETFGSCVCRLQAGEVWGSRLALSGLGLFGPCRSTSRLRAHDPTFPASLTLLASNARLTSPAPVFNFTTCCFGLHLTAILWRRHLTRHLGHTGDGARPCCISRVDEGVCLSSGFAQALADV